jgi:hypothetical protein
VETRKALIRLVAIMAAALVVVVALFVLPAHDPEPHGVKVAVVGGQNTADAIQQQVDQQRPGAFEIVPTPDPTTAREAILDRDVYAAVVPAEQRLMVASAASPVIAELIRAPFGQLAPRVEDVRRTDPEDPRGAAINLMMLPLCVLALPLAALKIRLPTSRTESLLASLAFALLGGLLVTLLMNPVLGVLPGPFLALWGIASLIIASVALPSIGLARLIGPAGIGIVAVIVVLIGNPGSGNATAPELLPGFWRTLGPLLPPGAGGQGLRNVAYFDGAALAQPLIVLAVFSLAGLGFLLASKSKSRISE